MSSDLSKWKTMNLYKFKLMCDNLGIESLE